MTVSRDAVLAELGIPGWRARPGVSFPGGPAVVADISPFAEAPRAVPVEPAAVTASSLVSRETPRPQAVDICLHADAHDADEAELLERMAEAVRGLREGLRVATAGLQDQPIHGAVAVRMDGDGLPSLAAMAADPALKRPVWHALKDAVARLS
ncbi:MAG: hypothetical protein ACOZAI_03450 [Pseudomonadota bacterium]